MTEFAVSPESLMHTLNERLASFAVRLFIARDAMVTVEVPAEHYAAALRTLHEDPACAFEQLVDLCGLDYSDYADRVNEGPATAWWCTSCR